jgi:hypothetical protein
MIARYFALDPRSLGLARIYLGCLLLTDLLRRAAVLPTWYTNEGPLPNHVLLWRPLADYQFSFFFLASNRLEAGFWFGLCGVAYLLFALGFHTRVTHVLSLIAVCSLHNRVLMFEDGAEVTTRLLTFWTVFLPMGAAFSIDALRAGAQQPPERRPAVSLAVLAILLQVALLYTFNVLHKTGATWREGTAVHYALHQDRIVSWLGWQLRPHLTLGASKVLTYAAVATEAALPVLLLIPFGWKLARRVAVVLAIGLHISFALLLNLALFSFNMIGFFLLFLTDRDWELLARAPLAIMRPLRAARQAVLRVLRALSLDGPPPPPSPLRTRLAKYTPRLREATVAVFMIALGSQMMVENQALPNALRVRDQPLLLRLLVEYPRFYEGWSMFAPDAPARDAFMFVDAVTVDGRHVDPVNLEASRVATLPVTAIPEFLDMEDNWADYTMNVVGREDYYGTLAGFIRDYPRRTGDERDQIRSFQVWIMEDASPKPGESRPHNVTKSLLFEEK